ncbi:WD40/YVTN/BNR-like repeat-containing protein [Cohnella caldifontis]|uniref:WD40/YVTN/BNR-like repeat-containing protein n=1 Tax=Cohnella caldifontis TaxID=3027471 RepID=UPI0023ED6D29|nr:hypothetical protein [Cohnella sp. YIM B05605]
MNTASRFRWTAWLLGLSLLLAAAGCTGGNTSHSGDASGTGSPPVASSSPPSSAPAESSPAASPSASPPAASSPAAPKPIGSTPNPTVEVPVNPPPVSKDLKGDTRTTGAVYAVRMADPQTGWTGGDGWIARTTDGGKHWTVQLRPQFRVLQIFALNANKAWATLDIGDKRGAKLIRTTDGGKTWTDAGVVPSYGFFHFVSDKEAFSSRFRTTDGGKTWTALPTPGKLAGEAYFHDAANGWAVTNGTKGFSILRTTDGGQSWKTVFTRDSIVLPTDAIIRSAGKNDAWVELVGNAGMSQRSYSLFHTTDGGKTWQPVVANSGAGSGPAPGFAMDENKVPRNGGSSPGTLYVVNTRVAFLGGQCQACDNPNTLGKTTDGGKTWKNLTPQYPGYAPQQIAATDADHVWWINADSVEPSRMYVTSDGGKHWTLTHTFDKPKG